MAGPGLAEEKTLIGDLGEIEHGGFGGPMVKFTQIDGEFGVLTGGRGGWIIDHRFVLGGGGYGLANNIGIPIKTKEEIETEGENPEEIETEGENPEEQDLEMGYGGAMLEFIIASDALIHFSVDCLIGAGGMTTPESDKDDAFFVLEPGLNVMLNITQFFRFGAGVSYRYTQGVEFGELDDGDLSGAAAVLTFKFGSF